MRVPSILLKPWVTYLSWHEEENQVDQSAMTSNYEFCYVVRVCYNHSISLLAWRRESGRLTRTMTSNYIRCNHDDPNLSLTCHNHHDNNHDHDNQQGFQVGSVWVPKARVDKCLLRRQGSDQGEKILRHTTKDKDLTITVI